MATRSVPLSPPVIPVCSMTGKCKVVVLLKGIPLKVGMLLMREVHHKEGDGKER